MAESDEERKGVIGSSRNFWLYSTSTGFDLTHPPTPTSQPLHPRLTFKTTTANITVDPAKTALVIIDMQNFFLSPSIGRPTSSNGLRAQEKLLRHAIPAARKAGIRIVWLNWGLTEQEIEDMPPGTSRAFGFETVAATAESFSSGAKQVALDDHGMNSGVEELAKTLQAKPSESRGARIYCGLGKEIGKVEHEDGTVINGGRLLMRDQWNSALTPELDAAYQTGKKTANPPDVWIHKNRMSGLWGSETACTKFFEQQGIRTLLFSGVNTDQCVGGSLQDAFSKGWDCILLSDGAGTTSPDSSQQSIEFNCAKTWGFSTTCEEFATGATNMAAGTNGDT